MGFCSGGHRRSHNLREMVLGPRFGDKFTTAAFTPACSDRSPASGAVLRTMPHFYQPSTHPLRGPCPSRNSPTFRSRDCIPSSIIWLLKAGWKRHKPACSESGKLRSFELLLAFGQDCAGAVSIQDPAPAALDQTKMDMADPKQVALLKGRASLSGIQPKFTLVQEKGTFRPARSGEISTHIAKFPSLNHADLVMNEYLTMQAFKALCRTTLLPNSR